MALQIKMLGAVCLVNMVALIVDQQVRAGYVVAVTKMMVKEIVYVITKG